jgi:hypothetical protein
MEASRSHQAQQTGYPAMARQSCFGMASGGITSWATAHPGLVCLIILVKAWEVDPSLFSRPEQRQPCWLLCCPVMCAGRWKATPVAVKIIEHYSSAEGVGSSRGNRVSAGREMLFATSISHPNLVSLTPCYNSYAAGVCACYCARMSGSSCGYKHLHTSCTNSAWHG